MTDKDVMLTAIFDNFLKAAKVNIFTGEYHFIKDCEEEKDAGCLEFSTIEDYAAAVIKQCWVHPDDVGNYLYHMNLSYLQNKIMYQRQNIVHSFRRRTGNAYQWITFEITIPGNFKRESPWVFFSWKESDSDTRALEDALLMLSSIFHKILKINLTADSYEKIKVYEAETEKSYGYSASISEWFQNFAECGNVYEDDKQDYLFFTRLNYLREAFFKKKGPLQFHYRRKINDTFRWVTMELLPSIEYTDDNQIVLLYIRDVHDSHIAELKRQKELEYYCNYDILTKIHNRYFYNNFCLTFSQKKTKPPIGVLFADINNLKYINDTYGHQKGDAYLQQFSRLLTEAFGEENCCRISGDEFVVFFEGYSHSAALQKTEAFRQRLMQEDSVTAAVGFAWSSSPGNLEALICDAEKNMYLDKTAYYQQRR